MHRKGFPGRQRIGRKIYHVQRVKLLAIKRGICLSYSNINDVVIDAILSLLPNHVPFLHYLEKKIQKIEILLQYVSGRLRLFSIKKNYGMH